MAQDSILQINNNIGKIKCQAFDPMMLLEEKRKLIQDGSLKQLNVSCVAPSSVYTEGGYGTKYLCDFHYVFEYQSTYGYDPLFAVSHYERIIYKLQEITETFADPPDNGFDSMKEPCWCGSKSYVFIKDPSSNDVSGYCNFHFRKVYYRFLSNGIDLYKQNDILDYRKLMASTIEGEILCLPVL